MSVNLLTDEDYQKMTRLPHDVDVDIDVWAAFLSRLLNRPVGTDTAVMLITEYNRRLNEDIRHVPRTATGAHRCASNRSRHRAPKATG